MLTGPPPKFHETRDILAGGLAVTGGAPDGGFVSANIRCVTTASTPRIRTPPIVSGIFARRKNLPDSLVGPDESCGLASNGMHEY
jgi:hypothetical protein